VLTIRLPDPGRMLGLPGALARPLARRAHEINRAMDAVAQQYATVHFDAAGDEDTYDPRMWAADRLHPNERGHRLIACKFHGLLAAAGLARGLARSRLRHRRRSRKITFHALTTCSNLTRALTAAVDAALGGGAVLQRSTARSVGPTGDTRNDPRGRP
jgi:hypothetical protein